MVAKGSERLGVLCVSLALFPLNIMAASRPQTHGLPAGTPKISAFSLL